MKIALFTDTYMPEVNGVAVSVSTLKDKLTEMGHEVFVITVSNPQAPQNEENVIRVHSMPLAFLPSRRLGVTFSAHAAVAIKKENFDIIHTHTEFSLGLFGRFMAFCLRKPVVHTCHTLYKDYAYLVSKGHFKGATDKLIDTYLKAYCKNCNRIIVPTEKVKKILRQSGIKTPAAVIPTGINLDKFKQENYSEEEIVQLRARYGIGAEDFVLLFVGRIGKEKSLDQIIDVLPEIFRRQRHAKMLIVGDGPAREDLMEQAKSLGIADKVIFTGEVLWSEVGKYYQMGNAFVNASTSETQGLTYIEAIAAGLPVIAMKDECLEGLVEDGVSGLTFENQSQCAEKILEAIDSSELTQSLVVNAQENARVYYAENYACSIEQLYKEVLDGFGDTKRGRSVRAKIKRKDEEVQVKVGGLSVTIKDVVRKDKR